MSTTRSPPLLSAVPLTGCGWSAGTFSCDISHVLGSRLARSISPGRAPRPNLWAAIAPSRDMLPPVPARACEFDFVSLNEGWTRLRRNRQMNKTNKEGRNSLTYKDAGVDID